MFQKRGNNAIRKWWWEIDGLLLLLILSIAVIGALLITTASPAVAERIGLRPFHFVYKHFVFLGMALVALIGTSAISESHLKKLALSGLFCCIILMIAVLFIGEEVKGARRWISLRGFSLQPSELIKPFLAVIIGLILAESGRNYKRFIAASLIYLSVAILLLLQPDFGMTVSITAVTCLQFFIAGLPLIWIFIIGISGIFSAGALYFVLPHVAKRVNGFLYADESENYQVERSLEAYINGGLFGRGPGEGSVKAVLPDSHTDFIFSVAGEELGGCVSSLIILIFCAVVLRGLGRLIRSHNLFHIYAASGLLMHFAFQSIFNIGVTLHLLPTKGMTLPFMSYGGSSILSFGIAMGMCINLAKRRTTINTGFDRSRNFNALYYAKNK